jgi:hypothetical protein
MILELRSFVTSAVEATSSPAAALYQIQSYDTAATEFRDLLSRGSHFESSGVHIFLHHRQHPFSKRWTHKGCQIFVQDFRLEQQSLEVCN